MLKKLLTENEIARLMMLCGAIRDLSEVVDNSRPLNTSIISKHLKLIQEKIEGILKNNDAKE